MGSSIQFTFVSWLIVNTILLFVGANPDSANNANPNRNRCHAEYGIRLEMGGLQRLLDSVRCFNTNKNDITAFLTTLKINQTIDLDISESSIPFLDRQLFSGINIRRLRISKSALKSVSTDAFDSLENVLEELDLTENHLEIFPSAVRNLTVLRILKLSRNKIETLPEGTVFFNLLKLRQLDLSYNRLGYLDSARKTSSNKTGFIPLGIFNLEPLRENLQYLSLRGNNMNGFLEQFLRPFSRLRELDLSHNKFTEIPPEAFNQMPQLEKLDLEKNSLEEFKLHSLPVSLKSLSLGENPLHCDCSITWLWNLARNFSSNLELSLPKCHLPYAFRNLEISSLENLCSNQTLLKPNYDIQYIASTQSVEVRIQRNHSETEDFKLLQLKTTVRRFATSEKTHTTKSEQLTSSGLIAFTIEDLVPRTGYVICTEVFDVRTNVTYCEELETLAEEEVFPTAEVAVAASVSTSTTIFVVVIVCCCCPKRSCKKQRSKTASDRTITEEFANDETISPVNGMKSGNATSLSDKYSRLNGVRVTPHTTLRTTLNVDDEESARVFQATCEYLRQRNQAIATGTLKRIRENRRTVAGLTHAYYLQPIGSEELQSRVHFNATYGSNGELNASFASPGSGSALRSKRRKYYTWATCPITWSQEHYENFLANPAAYKHRSSISQLSIPFCSMPPAPSGTSQQFFWSAAPAPSTMNLQF